MSKFERISTFINVVEENSFAAAARKQNVSSAAISRQISLLEDSLGIQLLQRSTRHLKLTEVGMVYYQQCKKAFQDFNEVENSILGSKDVAHGTLRITSSRYFGMHYLLPRINEFMQENPQLYINLELAERFPDLIKEEIDLLFGIYLEGPDNLVRRKVATTKLILCASPQYLAKNGTPKIPADLAEHRYIAHAITNCNVIPFKDGKEVYVEPFLKINDNRALVECALRHMGIVRTHCHTVHEELANGNLIQLLADFAEPCKPVHLYYQQNRYLQPKIRRFIDFYIPTIND